MVAATVILARPNRKLPIRAQDQVKRCEDARGTDRIETNFGGRRDILSRPVFELAYGTRLDAIERFLHSTPSVTVP